MTKSSLKYLIWLISLTCSNAFSETMVYPASCGDSVIKIGKFDEDLTDTKGLSYACDAIIMSKTVSGNLLIQFSKKKSNLAPLAFTSGKINREDGDDYLTLILDKLNYPQKNKTTRVDSKNGFEGFCFVNIIKPDLSNLEEINCSGRYENKNQKIVFKIKPKILGKGFSIPNM